MKNKTLPPLLLLGSTHTVVQIIIESPPFETRQGSAHTISKIELSPTETWLTIRAVFHLQWWTSIDGLTYTYVLESRKQFYPFRIEGRKFGERVTTPASGVMKNGCVITYSPLPESTTRVGWIGDDLESEINTYGTLLVKPQEAKEWALLREIRGNWQQTDAGNGWDIGICDSLAIMNSRFRKYELCRKQGKKLKPNLRSETDRQCQLEITQEKDGNIRVGKNGEKGREYIHAGLPHRGYASVTIASTTPRADFFRKDVAHIHGFLDGYNSQLEFTIALIYTDNRIIREDSPVLVTIRPGGHFESDFVASCPRVHHPSLGSCWIGFYVRPGETLVPYLSWEDLLDYNRQRRSKSILTETQYTGASGALNQGSMPCEPFFPRGFSALSKACGTLTSDEFKARQKPMYDLWIHRLGSLEQSKTLQSEGMQMLKNNVKTMYGSWPLDFILQRGMSAHKDTTNTILKIKEVLDYCNLPKKMSLGDVRAIGCSFFSAFINRLEYMNPLNRTSWQIRIGTDNHVKKCAESWQRKEGTLEGTTGTPFPMAGELILTRSCPFPAGILEDGKKTFTLFNTLKGYLHELFLTAESKRIYR